MKIKRSLFLDIILLVEVNVRNILQNNTSKEPPRGQRNHF